MSQIKFVCALLAVEDIAKSKEFYASVLEQKIKFDFGENVTFVGDFAIQLKSHYQKLLGKGIRGGENNVELYFEFDDVDGMEKRLEAAGVEFVHRTVAQPWLQKALRCYDPDGYIVEIGESLERLSFRLWKTGMRDTEIAAAVGIPVELVRTGIDLFK